MLWTATKQHSCKTEASHNCIALGIESCCVAQATACINAADHGTCAHSTRSHVRSRAASAVAHADATNTPNAAARDERLPRKHLGARAAGRRQAESSGRKLDLRRHLPGRLLQIYATAHDPRYDARRVCWSRESHRGCWWYSEMLAVGPVTA